MRIDLTPYLAQRNASCVYAVYTIPVVQPAPAQKRARPMRYVLDGLEALLTLAAGGCILGVLSALVAAV